MVPFDVSGADIALPEWINALNIDPLNLDLGERSSVLLVAVAVGLVAVFPGAVSVVYLGSYRR